MLHKLPVRQWYSRAAKALISCGIDQTSEEAKKEMEKKHPVGNPIIIPEGDIETPSIQFRIQYRTSEEGCKKFQEGYSVRAGRNAPRTLEGGFSRCS